MFYTQRTKGSHVQALPTQGCLYPLLCSPACMPCHLHASLASRPSCPVGPLLVGRCTLSMVARVPLAPDRLYQLLIDPVECLRIFKSLKRVRHRRVLSDDGKGNRTVEVSVHANECRHTPTAQTSRAPGALRSCSGPHACGSGIPSSPCCLLRAC